MVNIFQMVNDQFSGIISQAISQSNIVEQSVRSPLNRMVTQVTGGIWKGDGANRFATEMTGEVLPMLAGLMTVNNNYANALRKSQDRMTQAFHDATQVAQGLQEVFSQIF